MFAAGAHSVLTPTTVTGVTIRLAVNEPRWLAHVQGVAKSMPGLVPVVKGNGYGFRRWNLMPLAGQLSNEIAVGTVFEVRDIPSNVTPIVLTPTMTAPPKNLPLNTVLTVGSRHLDEVGRRCEVAVVPDFVEGGGLRVRVTHRRPPGR